MIHIVFNEPDKAVLQQAIEIDESLRGDVLQVKDDYAVGPLADLYTSDGREARRLWWKEVLAGGDYDGKADSNEVDDAGLVAGLLETLQEDPQQVIWIWAAQNKHDVSGYYWLVSQLKDFQGRIFILYLNNLPFINEKGHIFYPEWLHSIPPKEFVKAKRLARAVTLSEFETDPDEWNRLANENKGVRLLEGGKKLVQKEYDFYDAELLKFINTEWQKAGRIIRELLSKGKHTTGDAYLLWRIKHLVAAGLLEVQGEQKKMKDFEVKEKSAALQSAG